MGIKAERKHILDFKYVYDNIKITYGNKTFRMVGKIEDWSHIEIITRIFYKKLERLLYGDEVTNTMYETSIKKVLDENGLLDCTFFEVIKKKDYQFEALNTMLVKIFDFVYFNVKKMLPYTKKLSLYANAVSELLENTYKYSSRDYAITAGILDTPNPLVIKIENSYEGIDENTVKERLTALNESINEINQYDDPDQAFLEIMKKRMMANNDTEMGDQQENSRLGFAKMRADTKAKISFLNESKFFGKNGITIILSIPIVLAKKEELLEIIKSSI